MEADLHAIIRSGQPLTDQHFQSFIYQTLCGLLVSIEIGVYTLCFSLYSLTPAVPSDYSFAQYIHSASVLHRDLKPGGLRISYLSRSTILQSS